MRKTANTLILVGAILSIVLAVSFLITAIVFFAISSDAVIEEMLKTATYEGTEEEAKIVLKTTFITLGVVFAFVSTFGVINAIVAFVGRKKESRAAYILNIVFGLLSGVEINAAGGVVGTIYATKRDIKEKEAIENKE